MGLNPAYLVTANDRDITDIIARRLVSLSVTTETEHQSDELTLTLWNDPLSPIRKPSLGAMLTLDLGYEQELTRMGNFIVSSLSGQGGKMQGQTMTIQARAAPYSETPGGVTEFQTQKSRSWRAGTTIGAMVAKMASEHGMKAGVSSSLAPIALQHLDQTEEADISFLQKIARHYDAVAKPAGGKLLFITRGESQSASGAVMPPVSLTSHQISEWRWSEDRHITPGTVIALYHETRKAQTFSVSIGSGEPVRRLRRKFRTASDARAAAQAEMARRARSSIEMNLTLPGDATLNGGTSIILDHSLDESTEGQWIIRRATHRLGKQEGFITELDCERPNNDDTVQAFLKGPVHVAGL
ncbi:contractile injection system protein, VgrG/Pvc8 family [Acetobacteraceae bacterium ESL0709]|nr:contractile injection system protein, VgrG/Pvc8 family [Acetobacteraceae bacterium ESL0697]MDF7677370.1 contractile injection system protein, VgrG/Pvc8 family [Acetobacteraceae bacterium ESL0709]